MFSQNQMYDYNHGGAPGEQFDYDQVPNPDL